MSDTARRWRTARKEWRCEEAYQWAHAGQIHRGDRYLKITALSHDIVPFGTRMRLCSECAVGMPEAPADPRSGS